MNRLAPEAELFQTPHNRCTAGFVRIGQKHNQPASLKLATLLDKPSRRVHPEVVVDYCGFTIEDKFVVGYGLDYDQYYRNLNYIGYVIFDEE